jgi:phospholipase/carboxylesterase
VTINGGMQMRAWYDILGFDRRAREDAAGIHASAAAVTELVDREIERGLSSDSIVLAGFSQGGAIALHTALRSPKTVGRRARALDLSAAGRDARERAQRGECRHPAIHGPRHGRSVLPFGLAETSRRALEALGYVVDWHAYRMAHSVCMEEVRAIGAWLSALPAARG